MVMPQQAGPQPCGSMDDFPRPITQDRLCELRGVMHQMQAIEELFFSKYRSL